MTIMRSEERARQARSILSWEILFQGVIGSQ